MLDHGRNTSSADRYGTRLLIGSDGVDGRRSSDLASLGNLARASSIVNASVIAVCERLICNTGMIGVLIRLESRARHPTVN
jgi:hypothetical protein